MNDESKVNILIGCTGSVAAKKILDILNCFKENLKDAEICIVTTKNAKFFFPQDLNQSDVVIYSDEDEWDDWKYKQEVLHINLAQRWADVFVISPLDANTLAKLTHGMSDNLLTSIARAWDFESGKKILVAPAMNTKMWEHPVTAPQESP